MRVLSNVIPDFITECSTQFHLLLIAVCVCVNIFVLFLSILNQIWWVCLEEFADCMNVNLKKEII